jgi:hypothetical protein
VIIAELHELCTTQRSRIDAQAHQIKVLLASRDCALAPLGVA